jgi:hypothetical protein
VWEVGVHCFRHVCIIAIGLNYYCCYCCCCCSFWLSPRINLIALWEYIFKCQPKHSVLNSYRYDGYVCWHWKSVIRLAKQSWCILFTNTKLKQVRTRAFYILWYRYSLTLLTQQCSTVIRCPLRHANFAYTIITCKGLVCKIINRERASKWTQSDSCSTEILRKTRHLCNNQWKYSMIFLSSLQCKPTRSLYWMILKTLRTCMKKRRKFEVIHICTP